jgi:TRAP-type C4-dicarboxylate transport system substrate-binding protein
LIKQVQSGRVDLIWTINGYSDRKFIRSEVFELPFVHTNDPVATNLAMREMLESDLKEDYENLEVMFLHVYQGQAFQNKGYSVRKPEDLRGKRVRVPSRIGAWVVEKLGAKNRFSTCDTNTPIDAKKYGDNGIDSIQCSAITRVKSAYQFFY